VKILKKFQKIFIAIIFVIAILILSSLSVHYIIAPAFSSAKIILTFYYLLIEGNGSLLVSVNAFIPAGKL